MGFTLTPWIELIISVVIFIGIDYYFEVVAKHSAIIANVINAVIGFLFLGSISDQNAPVVELLEIIAYIYLLVKNKHVMNLIIGKKSAQSNSNYHQSLHTYQSPRFNNTSVQHNNFQHDNYRKDQFNNQKSNIQQTIRTHTNLRNSEPASDDEDKELKRQQIAQIKKAQEMMNHKSSHDGSNTKVKDTRSDKYKPKHSNHSTIRSAQLAQIKRAEMISNGKDSKAPNSSSKSNDLDKFIH